MKTYTWDEITKMQITKSKFAAKIGITIPFDTALPQAWLNDFVATHDLGYHKVLYSTFATYPKDSFGPIMVSGWKAVSDILNKENES